MSLSPGTKLGSYEILSPLGAGGMGEVYKARDARLGRDVAVKVLPEEFFEDEERRIRFEREARTLASLNHPGIAAIYSFEETPGSSSSSASRHLLVMELVEGEGLDRKVASGPLPLEESLSIARQIAEALEAAHEKGIVHRDLKPANVKVTPGGRVKLLDFGLARASGAESGAPDTEETLAKLTQAGTIVGTIPYMSPEQIEARPLDHRTDLFSLGVVLYEMATGERPFAGGSSPALMSSILRDEPQPVSSRRPGTPDGLSRLVSRCLEKRPCDRIQTASEILADLNALRRAHESGAGTSASKAAADPGAARAEEGFWVAVLPFKSSGGSADLTALAEALSEDIVTGLSRFSYLRVISKSSTSRYANAAVDVRAVGKEIGARYVMEGSLRRAGAQLRVAVQLVDASTGGHLWAETYTRPFEPDQIFAIQDDLVPRIVSTCADHFGVLARSISDAVRGKESGRLSPYEALMRGFGYHHRLTPAEHAEAREVLERAVERAPANADCWAMLSWICSHEHAHGFNVRPGSLERALAAARRAVDIAPSNHLAQQALAVVLFFRKETAGCLSAAERALALNPLDGSNEAIFLITFTGDWERGCGLIRRAMELNPHHPRWYGLVLGMNEYRLANYRAAVDEVVKANAPEVFWTNAVLAAAHGQLGELPPARNALRDLLAQKEDFAQSAGELMGKWFEPKMVAHLMEGLRKAGLEAAPDKGAGAPALEPSDPPAAISGAVRAEEGFWVAVLPFKYSGSNTDLTALADGLSEEIVTGLSRFSYLRVIARGASSRLASGAADVRTVAREIGARYVMEGSLRQAGTRLRLAVQLVDATSGAHLWAENFERAFSPERVFELQDDLVPRIVSTVADMYGVLPRSMSEALRGKADEELSPHEAVLSAFGYMERVTPEEHARVRRILERAVGIAPNQSDAWAMLANLYWEEHAHGLNPQPDPLGRALAAARRAVEAAPGSNLAHYALASTLFFQKDFLAFRSAAERAIELNRMDASVAAYIGNLIAYAGDWERGCAVVESAMQLNPQHPGWYWFANFNDAYRRRDYRGALGFALKINLPGNFYTHAVIAAAYGQLGMREEARKSLQELLAIRPDFAKTAREEFLRWFDDLAFVEHQIDGLRKAGLDVAAPARARGKASARDAAVAIAVLPFTDMSAAKDQDWFCEGMAEEIMNALVGIGGLRVASRTSAFRARRQGADLPAIGKLLSVGQVLEGSVRTAGDRLRVTAQLTDVASGFQLWSERFDRKAEDVFAVQDEIAAGVVEAVKARLAPGERAVRARPQVANLEAYRHYLMGRHLRYTKNDHGNALRSFEQAVALDPSHAPSWVALAEIKFLVAFYGLIPARAAAAAARTALATAATLQGESTEALCVEGLLAFGEWRWAAAERALTRAIELEPDNVRACCWRGIVLSTLGREDEAARMLQHARDVDPLASYPLAMTGFCLLAAGRVADAERHLDEALAFEAGNILALWTSGLTLTARGRHAEGIARLDTALTPPSRGSFVHGVLGWALATAGRRDEARNVLAEMRARSAPAPAIVSEGWLLAALGETDAAWEALEHAEKEGAAALALTGMPGFDLLRGDPRFAALRKRLGLPS